jgi:hypothetical protein
MIRTDQYGHRPDFFRGPGSIQESNRARMLMQWAVEWNTSGRAATASVLPTIDAARGLSWLRGCGSCLNRQQIDALQQMHKRLIRTLEKPPQLHGGWNLEVIDGVGSKLSCRASPKYAN